MKQNARIAILGGGPAGLYLSILVKRRSPDAEVVVFERNPRGKTWGFGVVFSDETLSGFATADAPSYDAIAQAFAHWSAIDVFAKGEHHRAGGHGFAGLARRELLRILEERALSLGVQLRNETEAPLPAALADWDLVVAADGVRSQARASVGEAFGTSIEPRRAKYIWLGTTRLFDAFTFDLRETTHGLFQCHAYRFDEARSTFIVECSEATWRAAGLHEKSPEESAKHLEGVFAERLSGHPLLLNDSRWLTFGTLRNERWAVGNVVLLGDAAHTAHFSIGSGTKLAMEDAIELSDSLARHPGIPEALADYEARRRPQVERTQKVAQDSLEWFEGSARYLALPAWQLAASLLTRSKKITWSNLRERDPALVGRWQQSFSRAAGAPDGTPPGFTPFSLRSVKLKNRVVVSPMCMYAAKDGLVDDFHLAHYGARALGGAGLVICESTAVEPAGRITPGCAGIWSAAHAAAWGRVVELVHRRSSAKIGLQLGHAGRKGSCRVPSERGYDVPLQEGAWQTVGPSEAPFAEGFPAPHALTREELDALVRRYVTAADLASEAGFDLLELHMAHGYLLHEFLSPLVNRRADDYGGPLANRMRLPLEVLDAVRAAWPAQLPITVRISAVDWAEDGFTDDDAVELARALKAHGADAIDVSTGGAVPQARPVYGRMWQAKFSDRVRQEAGIATIAVGNIASMDQIDTLVASGRADLCALARPHLIDPNFTLRAAIEAGLVAHDVPPSYRAIAPTPKA